MHFALFHSIDDRQPTMASIAPVPALPIPLAESAAGPSSSRAVREKIVASHHLASGALSGFTSAIVLQPLDLVKTRLQQSYDGSVGSKR